MIKLASTFFFILINAVIINAQTELIIGATGPQIPFVFKDKSGLANDITEAMNNIQKKYKFIFKQYPAKRLNVDLMSGSVHIAAFSNLNWGFDSKKVDSSYNVIYSKDLYIAFSDKNKDQSFFKKVGKVKTVVVLGFHYKFANFILNQDTLRNIYNTMTTFSEPNVINMILNKRAEIGAVSSSLLDYLKYKNKMQYDSLLISENWDTKYARQYLVNKKAPISVTELNELFIILYKNGTLKKIYQNYGLEVPKFPN